MNQYLIVFIFLLFFSFPASGSVEHKEQGNDIDVVWSSSDGVKMEIYYSQRKDGIWQEPVQVTDDHYDNLYPVVDRDSNGNRWVFWTAYDGGETEIRYATGNGDEWQRSEDIPSAKKTNLSPSVVVDAQDNVWVVWSANDDDLDDIMYATNQNGVWSDPATIHEPNEAPDFLPVIDIGGDGTPRVMWRAGRQGENMVLSSRWLDNDWSEPFIEEVKEADQEKNEENIIELPQFITRTSMIFVRVY